MYEDDVVRELIRPWLGRSDLAYARERQFDHGARRADVVRLKQGQIVAYEIKSDRDSFARLEQQAISYQRCFLYSYLVVTPGMLAKAPIDKIGSMGIKVVQPGVIETYRKATRSNMFCAMTHLDLLKRSQLAKHASRQAIAGGKAGMAKGIADTLNERQVCALVYECWFNETKAITDMFEAELPHNKYMHPDDLMILFARTTQLTLR